MGVHARDHVDEIDLLRGEHLIEVGIGMRDVKFLRRRPGLGRIDVADRNQLHLAFAGEIGPREEMIAGKETAADQRDADRIGH